MSNLIALISGGSLATIVLAFGKASYWHNRGRAEFKWAERRDPKSCDLADEKAKPKPPRL
jgi:hypothetical protein